MAWTRLGFALALLFGMAAFGPGPSDVAVGRLGASTAAIGLAPSGAAAQSPEDTAEEASLRDVVSGIARSWGRGDAGGVLADASERGVRLQLAGGGTSPQSQRRAEAVLRRLLEEADGGRVSAGTVSVVGGTPLRGYGELLWESASPGAPGLVRSVVYLGFRMEEGRWRLTDIRLL